MLLGKGNNGSLAAVEPSRSNRRIIPDARQVGAVAREFGTQSRGAASVSVSRTPPAPRQSTKFVVPFRFQTTTRGLSGSPLCSGRERVQPAQCTNHARGGDH